jgi:hypothetical protein
MRVNLPPKLKNELHHWWPRSLSKFWADDLGHAHCISAAGELVRSYPKQFGAIRNDNNIGKGDAPSVWDESFEATFAKADSAFPSLVEWIRSLKAPIAPSEIPLAQRLTPFILENSQRHVLAECLASLIARSPNFRNRIRLTTEYYRSRFGFADPTPDKNLIGANVRGAQRVFSSAIRAGGKFTILLSGESEFIFGDGFLHNFSSADAPHNPRALIPLTPEAAVLYSRLSRHRSYPQGFTINLRPEETRLVNWTVQVYSKRFIFFRDIHPIVDEAFTSGEHLEVQYHKHPWVDALDEAAAQTFFGGDRQFYPSD